MYRMSGNSKTLNKCKYVYTILFKYQIFINWLIFYLFKAWIKLDEFLKTNISMIKYFTALWSYLYLRP